MKKYLRTIAITTAFYFIIVWLLVGESTLSLEYEMGIVLFFVGLIASNIYVIVFSDIIKYIDEL